MYFSIKLPKHNVIQKHNGSHRIICNAETDRNEMTYQLPTYKFFILYTFSFDLIHKSIPLKTEKAKTT